MIVITGVGKNESIDIESEQEPSVSEIETPVNSNEPSKYGDVVRPHLDLAKKLAEAKKVNDDNIGWLTVPGTGIDYPVLQYTDNKEYMRLDYNRKWKFAGSIFADFRDYGTIRDNLSKNYVIYGHNINTNHGTVKEKDEMFALLLHYSDFDFAKQNQHIFYSTYEDEMVWEIFAVFYTDVDFFYIDVNPESDESFEWLINEARMRSEYNYDVDVGVDDKIITLSTCAYKFDTKEEQRFVVMGKLVPNNEFFTNNDVEINPYPKLPSFVFDED